MNRQAVVSRLLVGMLALSLLLGACTSSVRETAGLITGGVGIVATVTGAVSFDSCPMVHGVCYPDDRKQTNTIGGILLGAGALVTIIGILISTLPPSE